MPKRWLLLVFGADAPVCISCLHCTDFGMHIAIGSGTVGICSSCSGTAYRSGSDNCNPCCSRLCHIKFVSQAFRFQCFICTFG